MEKPARNAKFEQMLVVSRRQLLASTAAVTTTALVPGLEQAKAANAAKVVNVTEAQQLEVSALNFSAATALRLREIAERNRLRREVGMPLLSVAKELRRMKEAAASEQLRKFTDAHRTRVYDKMLCRVRRRCGDPSWAPTGALSGGGLWFAVHVDEQTRKLYRRCIRRTGIACPL